VELSAQKKNTTKLCRGLSPTSSETDRQTAINTQQQVGLAQPLPLSVGLSYVIIDVRRTTDSDIAQSLLAD